MNLVTRVTEHPNGVKITETFEQAPENTQPANDTVEQEPFTIGFYYRGVHRLVANPQFLNGAYSYRDRKYNVLLGGVEVERDGVKNGLYKNYSVDLIEPA